MLIITIVFASSIAFGYSTPLVRRSVDNDVVKNDVEGNFINLFSFGDKLFGEPSPETGRKVGAWTAESEVHPEELGSYLEGDILHPSGKARNGITGVSFRWKSAIIPYEISPQFEERTKKAGPLAGVSRAKVGLGTM